MSPHALARLFDAFEQHHRRPDAGIGGLGLGLAISRSLAKQQGGSLIATSQGLGEGATLTAQFPLATAPHPTPRTSQDTLPPKPTPQLHILLVEDHPDTALAMHRLLTRFGYNVTTAPTIAAARDTITQNTPSPFNLIISDIGLPDGTGMDLIQSLHPNHPIPAIALSGFGMEADIQRAIDAGFTAHLTKPINIRQLEETIHNILIHPPQITAQPAPQAAIPN